LGEYGDSGGGGGDSVVVVVVVVVVVFNTQAFGGIPCTFYRPIIIIYMYYGKFYLRFTVSCACVGNLLNI
jgi:hypothetical protein